MFLLDEGRLIYILLQAESVLREVERRRAGEKREERRIGEGRRREGLGRFLCPTCYSCHLVPR